MTDFQTYRISDAQCEVTDAATGHNFTFTVVILPDRSRVLSEFGNVIAIVGARPSAEEIGYDARQFAAAEMIKAGKIDRSDP